MPEIQKERLSFNRYNVKRAAFTLAEVLITLGIIGVVAALTIPTLMNNVTNQQYVTKLQKVYTTLNQAIQKYEVDNGCMGDLKCTGLYSDTIANNISKWDDFVNNYLKVVKNCGISTDQDCFPVEYFLNIAGSDDTNIAANYYKFVLADGTSLAFQRTSDCGTYTTADPSNQVYGYCGEIRIDVNGNAKPNKKGRDYFNFGATQYHGVVAVYGSYALNKAAGIDIWSTTNVGMNCLTTATSYGSGCAARIIDEGWKMNY